jgi:hypothetical protein
VTRFRLREKAIDACRWHGDQNKKDVFKEVEETFGVSHHRGQIGKMLGGAIGVHDGTGRNGANAQPGQWLIRGMIIEEKELLTLGLEWNKLPTRLNSGSRLSPRLNPVDLSDPSRFPCIVKSTADLSRFRR